MIDPTRTDEWSHERDLKEWADRRQRVVERQAQGLSPYLLQGEPFVGLPRAPEQGRMLVLWALRQRAEFARGLVRDCRLAGVPLPPSTLRRIMRDMLPAEARRLMNQLHIKRRRWVAAGCPEDPRPWQIVEYAEGIR